ncbi:MAG TPA: AraC family transcriptional regulator [Firmicutes bacterium]|jgi:AraC-like DNA-binding protein|nr:AraC family transcriptional regulator [Bacillota bacterium]
MLTDFSKDLELVDRLETDYLKIFYYDFSQKFSGIYKSYEYNRLCTIIEGEKHLTVNKNDQFTYNQNQFLLLPPDSQVHMTIDVPTRALVFELNNDLIKNVSEKICMQYEIDGELLAKDRLFVEKDTLEIKESLTKFTSTIAKSDKNIDFLLDLYAQELVYNLIQIKGAYQVLNLEFDHPIYQAVKYMKDHYMQPISINQISSELKMSEAKFCQYFKKITGVAPKEYLTNLKLSKAKDMIKFTNVTEVALDLGYENISHFIALFKNKYGITPKQYKLQYELKSQYNQLSYMERKQLNN